MSVAKKKDKPCAFYLQPRGCVKGDQCDFQHTEGAVAPPIKQDKPCQFYLSARGCVKGDQCDFMHQAQVIVKEKVCDFYMTPKGCIKGLSCDFQHPVSVPGVNGQQQTQQTPQQMVAMYSNMAQIPGYDMTQIPGYDMAYGINPSAYTGSYPTDTTLVGVDANGQPTYSTGTYDYAAMANYGASMVQGGTFPTDPTQQSYANYAAMYGATMSGTYAMSGTYPVSATSYQTDSSTTAIPSMTMNPMNTNPMNTNSMNTNSMNTNPTNTMNAMNAMNPMNAMNAMNAIPFSRPDQKKPKICDFHNTVQGCVKGEACDFVHQQNKMCSFFQSPRGCVNGDHCEFKHSDDDSIPKAPKISRPCRYFSTTGQCRLGENCNFTHEQQSIDTAGKIQSAKESHRFLPY